MRILILCGMIMLSSLVQARPNQEVPEINPQVQEYYQITEKEMDYQGEQYRIFLAIPKATTKTSLLYSVDGNAQFPLIVNEIVEQNSMPLPVIVSIGYVGDQAYFIPERTRDYTPEVTGDEFKQGGNAERFYQFILTQVKPYADNQIETANLTITKRSLFGHSFGGVFTLYVLLNHPETFQHYTAASPSLWWGKGEWIAKEKWQVIPNDISVTITLGEKEETPDLSKMNQEQQQNHKGRSSWLTPRQLCHYLSEAGKQCDFQLFAGKTHGGSIPDAIKTAISYSAE
ncbi:alpha/beta hydrolase [Proteus hauseri]|nr:alpha/beta hydrolase-fold protein [Proteus hauseri]